MKTEQQNMETEKAGSARLTMISQQVIVFTIIHHALPSLSQGFSATVNPWVEKIPWRRKWQLTPVLLPGESHGQRSLVSYSPWGHKEPDMTE